MSEDVDFVGMIRDSAGAIAPRGGSLERIRALRFTAPGHDPATWRQMAELGWIGLRVSEERGGVGLGMAASVALYEELGRGLVPEPLIAGALAAGLLEAAGEDDLLARLIGGEGFVATAWAGHDDAIDAAGASDIDRRFVTGADAAEAILWVTGDTLRLIPRDRAIIDGFGLQDGGFAATVAVSADAGRTLALDDASAVIARVLDEAALGTAGYLLGVAERAFAMTVDYLGQRKQFGQPLGSFQSLQHRCADMKIQLTLTRASIAGAAAELDAGCASDVRAASVSRAKARAADNAMLVAREAIQLHGAIGYTDEYDVGLYARKAMVLANAFGSAAAHRRRFMAVTGDLAA